MAKRARKGEPADETKPQPLSDNVRGVVTVLILFQLFCIAVVTTANVYPSPLQERLRGVLRPYAQPLNFEMRFVNYHWTWATEMDVDYRMEMLAKRPDDDRDAESWALVGADEPRWSESRHRLVRLSRTIVFHVEDYEDENAPGRVAVGAANHFRTTQGGRLPRAFRVRRHNLVIWSDLANEPATTPPAWDESRFNAPYFAHLTYDADSQTFASIVQDDDATTAAPVGSEP